MITTAASMGAAFAVLLLALCAVPTDGASALLAINTTTLSGDAGWVQVTWTGCQCGTLELLCDEAADVIAMYPAGLGSARADINASVPISYFWASQQAPQTYKKSAGGTFSAYVVNMRQPVYFVYLRGFGLLDAAVFSADRILASSPLITFTAPNAPHNGRIALTGTLGEMAVTWQSASPYAAPQVLYGASSSALTHTCASMAPRTYTASQFCNSPANSTGYMSPGNIYITVLSGLAAATTYFYKFGDPTAGYSHVFSFITPPAPTTGPSSVNILVANDMGHWSPDDAYEFFGDLQNVVNPYGFNFPAFAPGFTLGSFYNAITRFLGNDGPQAATYGVQAGLISELTKGIKYNAFLLNGDVLYSQGILNIWDKFFQQMQPLIANVPFMTCPGNHEVVSPELPGSKLNKFPSGGPRYFGPDSGGECGISYEELLPMPNTLGPKPAGRGNQWYSFGMGPIFFIQMSSEQNYTAGSDQYKWVYRQLTTVDRTLYPWLVVGIHRPFYSDSTQQGDGGSNDDSVQTVGIVLRAAYENLFYVYSVDFIWTGHTHAYTRTCAVLNGTCQTNNTDGSASAPIHVMLGNAGMQIQPTNFHIKPDFFVVSVNQYGYSTVAANRTAVTMTVKNPYNGAIIDEFTVVKPHAVPSRAARVPLLAAAKKDNTGNPIPYPTLINSAIAETVIGGLVSELFTGTYNSSALEDLFGPGTQCYNAVNRPRVGPVVYNLTGSFACANAVLSYLQQAAGSLRNTTGYAAIMYGIELWNGRLLDEINSEGGLITFSTAVPPASSHLPLRSTDKHKLLQQLNVERYSFPGAKTGVKSAVGGPLRSSSQPKDL